MSRTLAIFIIVCIAVAACRNPGVNTDMATPAFDSLISKVQALSKTGKSREALRKLDSCKQANVIKTSADLVGYYYQAADFRRRLNQDYAYTIAAADTVQQILDNMPENKVVSRMYAEDYNMKADALFAIGLYSKSYDFYFKSKKIAEANGDSCSLSQYCYSLGIALYRQQKFKESLRFFKESFSDAAGCPDYYIYFYRKQELLDNIGLCYDKTGQYDSAGYYYNRTLDFLDANYFRYSQNEQSYISAKAVVYGNIADIFLARKSNDSAETYLKKSININLQKYYTNNDALLDQVKLAGLYLEERRLPAMDSTLTNMKAELDTIPGNDVATTWYKLKWRYYGAMNDAPLAYKYLLLYDSVVAARAGATNGFTATDAEERIRTIEGSYENKLLHNNNILQRTYILIATITTAMAVFIIFLVVRSVRRARRHIRQLKKLNTQVNDQKEKLELAIAELELKDKEKSRILRSVAHDVMNPIAAIISLTDILTNESPTLSGEQLEILKLIQEACGNSLNLSKDILETARSIEQSKTQMPREYINICELVTNCIELLRFSASAKSQELFGSFPHDPIMAYVNKDKIWRIMNNLISNAIKFSYRHSEIQVTVVQTGNTVHISVKDSGVGIPEKNKSRVFETFTEAKNTGTAGESTHGLGLSISLQLAKAHNGNLWFESEEGVGSTFHLEIPVGAPGVAAM